MAQKEPGELKSSCVWEIKYKDKNCFTTDAQKASGFIGFPLESFEASLHIKMENKLYHWVSLKKSTIVGAGIGLFALQEFKKGKFIGKLMGEVLPRDSNNLSEYAIRSPTIAVDPKGGINSGHPWYWGSHFVNDPKFVTRGVTFENANESKTLTVNSMIDNKMEMFATKIIKKGQEILLNYNYSV